jgi:hypothetical protein
MYCSQMNSTNPTRILNLRANQTRLNPILDPILETKTETEPKPKALSASPTDWK